MDKYQILEAIGEGSFGRVFRGHSLKTGETVALKFIPKRNKVDRELRSLRRECEIQQELFHPNIVRMVDAFETDREVVAVSEYVPVQLYSLLEKHGTLLEDKVRSIACNLISAIYYLHSLRILHRDIKPQNILLTEEGEAKLCDFGFSRKMGINTYVLTSIKGTPLYMAPELINESPYDHTADLWSLGCILFELLTGKPPFCTTSIVQLIKMVHLDSVKWPDNISVECRSFLEGLLQKEPSQRLTWPALLEHPWVENGVVILGNAVDPSALTYPLSSSQQQIKEFQKMQLLQQAMAQPKILKTLTKNSYLNAKALKKFEPNSNVNHYFPSDFNKMKIFADEKPPTEGDKEIEMTNLGTTAAASAQPVRNHGLTLGLNVRDAVGSSVRKLSTVSQESGFKAEDVADFTSHRAAADDRKDSMINYLSNSVDSSSRGSRPSVPILDINNQGNSALPNINEESIGNYSNTVAPVGAQFEDSSIKTIETEEWVRFLDKSLTEVLNGSFDIYKVNTELSMFISPLQNSTCPLVVTDKIATLLQLPFALLTDASSTSGSPTISDIHKVYLQCKVVPNLVYSCKLIVNSKISSIDVRPDKEFDKKTIQTLKSVLSLTCYLLYTNNNFVPQFCDAVCIFSTYKAMEIILYNDINKDISEKLIAILSQILRHSYDNVSIIDQILPNKSNVCSLLEKLLNDNSSGVRASTCTFIGYSAAATCSYVSCLENQHQILCDLINLENDQTPEVKRAASFAVSCLQSFTNLISGTDN